MLTEQWLLVFHSSQGRRFDDSLAIGRPERVKRASRGPVVYPRHRANTIQQSLVSPLLLKAKSVLPAILAQRTYQVLVFAVAIACMGKTCT